MPTRRSFLALAAAVPVAGAMIRPALAAQPPVFSSDGAAIRGYDPVAYFTEGAPVKGSPDFTAEHEGATFMFASAANRDLFLSDTQKYAPRYGGYCAYAVSQGATASTDPQAWTVVNDRLYLNYSLGVRDLWQQDISGFIALADGNWPAVLNR